MTARQEFGRRITGLVAICLLALFTWLPLAPLAAASRPAGTCGCKCPRSSKSCCCRRSAAHGSPSGAAWSAAPSCCGSRCPYAAVVSFQSDPQLPVAHKRPAAAQFLAAGIIPVIFDRAGCTAPGYLAFLHERPPPRFVR